MRALLPLAALIAAPAAAQTRPYGFDDALAAVSAAVRTAKAQGKAVAVAVVNREGRVLVAMRMDGVSFLNLEVAQAKAVTAAALGAPSLAIEQAVEGGKTSLLSVPGLSAIGGGVPVERGGAVVAGVGVSGGASTEDEAIARAAIK